MSHDVKGLDQAMVGNLHALRIACGYPRNHSSPARLEVMAPLEAAKCRHLWMGFDLTVWMPETSVGVRHVLPGACTWNANHVCWRGLLVYWCDA